MIFVFELEFYFIFFDFEFIKIISYIEILEYIGRKLYLFISYL